MDCYYAQVEMKKHNLDPTKPMAVLQWWSLIACNYPAKKAGVKRQMTAYDALDVCPEIQFVHVSTMIDNSGEDQMVESEIMDVHRVRQQNSYGSLKAISMFKV